MATTLRRRNNGMDAAIRESKILGLLGLAMRAGKLAVGATAVKQMVARGRNPVIVVARDGGEGLRTRFGRLEDEVAAVIDDAVDKESLAKAFGRKELAVVAVDDTGFVRGIRKIITGS